MNQDEIKDQLIALSETFKSTGDDIDDLKDTDLIEMEAEQLIIDYCVHNNYLVNGFPTEKKNLPQDQLEEDYFSRERFQYYLDILALQKEDVADLMYSYVSNFWADQYDSKEEYLHNLKDNLDSGVFYDVTI